MTNDSRMRINWDRYVGASTAFSLTSGAITSSETITNSIATWNQDITNTSVTLTAELSADNGSNYEEIEDATIHRFTSTGTQGIFRISGTFSNLYPTIKFSEYAFIYNLY